MFKDENRALIEQYRPISLLCSVSKVLEKLIFDELYEIVKTKLEESQHGFRMHRSVVTQMVLFLDLLYNEFDEKDNEIFVLYLDFKKAFDTVPQDLLINKVENLGVGGNFLKIVASYLSNTKQYVKVNDSESETEPVTSGVPQGSLLGPLLFIIYKNDLPQQTSKCSAFGYADDFKLVSTNPANIQSDLEKIEKWCHSNKMQLNESKCHILPIKVNEKNWHSFILNSKTLSNKSEQKDLGIIMATKLSWKANMKKRCSKAWKAFYFLKRNISNLASQTTKLNAYVGYVIPVISYASQAWFGNKTESKDIERIQRKATSWIISNWEISYKQRLTTMKLLPLSYYFELHDLLMLISLLKGSYNIKIPIKTNNNEGLLSTRQNELITINKTRARKADENFWKRTSYLLNIIRKVGNVDLDQIDQKYLTKIYWNYFFKSYSEVNLCSWAFNCSCGHCNPMQKLSSVVI